MKKLSLVAAMIALGLLIAACGDDEGEVTPSPSATATATAAATPTSEPTASPSPTPTAEPFDGTRGPVERLGPPVPPVAVLFVVQAERLERFDRVLFVFQDNMPGYRIEYVEPPILADASGLPVEIAGEAFLQVRFSVAQGHDEAGNTTVNVREFAPGLPSIVEAEQTGDFEGYVTWVIGLPEELDFRVSDLGDPFRVAIDIAHP